MSDTVHFLPRPVYDDADFLKVARDIPCGIGRKDGEFVASPKRGDVDCPKCLEAIKKLPPLDGSPSGADAIAYAVHSAASLPKRQGFSVDAKIEAIAGLMGLLQLVCDRDDVPVKLLDIVHSNHRWKAACAVLEAEAERQKRGYPSSHARTRSYDADGSKSHD